MYKISVQMDTGMTTLQGAVDSYSMQNKFTKHDDFEEVYGRRSIEIQYILFNKGTLYVRLKTYMICDLHMHKLFILHNHFLNL